MPLEIQPLKAIYDDDRDTVVFMGMDGARMVRCSVTRAALMSLARRRAQSAKEMLEAYRSHARRIHGIAATKYARRQLDIDGTVLVLERDVEAAD
ncbi:MAG TPA: DUF1488 family protein [Dongiaceae bacterium]|jgi:hypothetical protein|nr:DUF1488 family protein [Dongiaceae bacterium]